MEPLTDRQQAILDFLVERIRSEGRPPTLAEIAGHFGFSQARSAQDHLRVLAQKGHLVLEAGKSRGIRLVQPAEAEPAFDPATHLRLPVLGRVAAGAPIGADNAMVDQHVLLDRVLFSPAPDYLLRVKGDSMRDDGIFDGDLIAVHRTSDAHNGQVVVARIDDEITVKRYQRGRDQIRLLPRNPDYAPIVVSADTDFAIEGIYCGLVRSA